MNDNLQTQQMRERAKRIRDTHNAEHNPAQLVKDLEKELSVPTRPAPQTEGVKYLGLLDALRIVSENVMALNMAINWVNEEYERRVIAMVSQLVEI